MLSVYMYTKVYIYTDRDNISKKSLSMIHLMRILRQSTFRMILYRNINMITCSIVKPRAAVWRSGGGRIHRRLVWSLQQPVASASSTSHQSSAISHGHHHWYVLHYLYTHVSSTLSRVAISYPTFAVLRFPSFYDVGGWPGFLCSDDDFNWFYWFAFHFLSVKSKMSQTKWKFWAIFIF